jgi:hypothetical protein
VVDVAADFAHYILQEDPERLKHSKAVAERAKFLTLAGLLAAHCLFIKLKDGFRRKSASESRNDPVSAWSSA